MKRKISKTKRIICLILVGILLLTMCAFVATSVSAESIATVSDVSNLSE